MTSAARRSARVDAPVSAETMSSQVHLSSSDAEELSRLLQKKELSELRQVGTKEWIDLYTHLDNGRAGFYCAIIPRGHVDHARKNYSWDLRIGCGAPTMSVSGEGSDATVTLESSKKGVRPLIHVRAFHGIRPDVVEVAEEFRLAFNLFHDLGRHELIAIQDSGEEIVVATVTRELVRVRTDYLRSYLCAIDSYLAVYVDTVVWSRLPLDVVPKRKRGQSGSGDVCFAFGVYPADVGSDHQSFSRLLGKKLIPPAKPRDVVLLEFDERRSKKFATFRCRSRGRIREHTCDPDRLANNFGSNPRAPMFLATVFFDRTVLDRYLAKPSMYRVDDGTVRCADLWILHVDNNHDRFVVVHLGDLGKDLPYKEQLYWKSFNVEPPIDDRLSRTAFRRNILAEFADPLDPALVLREAVTELCRRWRQIFGWDLFLPLASDDAHHLSGLSIPSTDDPRAFDEQIMNLSKALSDSINVARLRHELKAQGQSPGDLPSIGMLEKYFDVLGIPTATSLANALRSIQAVRSTGAAHRKSGSFEKALSRFVGQHRGRADALRARMAELASDVKATSDHVAGRATAPDTAP